MMINPDPIKRAAHQFCQESAVGDWLIKSILCVTEVKRPIFGELFFISLQWSTNCAVWSIADRVPSGGWQMKMTVCE